MKKWVRPHSRPLAVKDLIDPIVPGPDFGKAKPFFFFLFSLGFDLFYNHCIVYLLLTSVGQLEM